MENLENIIESLLFVSEDPVTVDAFKEILQEADTGEIREALATLKDGYDARGGGFYLSEVAGGYQLRSRPQYAEWIRRMVQPHAPRLSKAALETLAIIAYRQPVIRSDVEHIRGVDSGGVIRMLLERKLIRILGRKEIPGRPLIYATTKLFLQVFDLKNLRDLPTPKEIETLSHEARLAEMPGELEPGEEAEDLETDGEPSGPEPDGDPVGPEPDGWFDDSGGPSPEDQREAPTGRGNSADTLPPHAPDTAPDYPQEAETGGQGDGEAFAKEADEGKNT